MAGIAAIRAGLETVLEGVSGIKSASGWPTENVGAVPYAFVGFDDDTITASNRELHIHHIPITVLVDRKGGNLVNQVKAVEGTINAVLAAIRANQSLGLTDVMRVEPMRIREGVYGFANTDYVGFILDVDIKESFAATYA